MAFRDSQRIDDPGSWLGSMRALGGRAEDWFARGRDPEVHRRRVRLFAVTFALLVIGFAGYALGSSRGFASDESELAGRTAGEQLGTVEGARKGFASAFEPARNRAYEASYRKAYETAYRDAFGKAELTQPTRVPVSRPLPPWVPR